MKKKEKITHKPKEVLNKIEKAKIKVEMVKVDENEVVTKKTATALKNVEPASKDSLDSVVLDLIASMELGAVQKETLISRIKSL